MNGLSARAEWRWNARATSSLPVPLSPWISTVARLGAARAIRSYTARIFALPPMISSKRCAPDRSRLRSSRFSRTSRRRSMALRRTTSTSSFLNGFGEVVERALLGRRDGALDGAERRDHHHRQLVVEAADLFEHLEAVLVRQHQVEQDRVDLPVAERVDALAAGGGRGHRVALDDEQRFERFADDLFVVDDEDGGRRL